MTYEYPEYVQTIEGIGIIEDFNADDPDFQDWVMPFGYYYTDAPMESVCDSSSHGGCSEDGIVWSVGDMGSPFFCTAHYFPMEQLGAYLVEMEEN